MKFCSSPMMTLAQVVTSHGRICHSVRIQKPLLLYFYPKVYR